MLAGMVLDPGPFPFVGEVIWLTPDQGGRRSGVPPHAERWSYAQVAHVAGRDPVTHTASFVLAEWDPQRWRSPARGKWLFEDVVDEPVAPGDVILVREGATIAAVFLVQLVEPG